MHEKSVTQNEFLNAPFYSKSVQKETKTTFCAVTYIPTALA